MQKIDKIVLGVFILVIVVVSIFIKIDFDKDKYCEIHYNTSFYSFNGECCIREKNYYERDIGTLSYFIFGKDGIKRSVKCVNIK